MRTRFAPSPTGYMHIGNLRTALYTWLLTRKMSGKFILRIEDTDQGRLVEGADKVIYDTLKQAGLNWDEGPDVGGEYGPYIQSERRDVYKEHAEKLVELGGAYYCFCDKSRLDEVRAIAEASHRVPMYDGFCKGLSKEEIKEKMDAGVPYVIRQKMPKQGKTVFEDAVFGRVEVENIGLEDQVLLKSDGYPTYNFANVVDDHLMKITHVIRGNEYLSSTPKYTLLYQSFGWEAPQYIHVSPVMKDSQSKLSKRNGDASYQDLIDKGYLNEAIINYIALLGWSSGEEREKYSLDEMIEKFSVDGISKSPSIFDINKLNWINGEYLRDKTLDEFHELALPYIRQSIKNEKYDTTSIAEVLQVRCEKLTEIPEQIDFFDELPNYDVDLFNHKKMKTSPETAKEVLPKILKVIEGLDSFDNLHDKMLELVEIEGLKNGQVLYPLRVALSGKAFTPGGGIEIAGILGKEETINRLNIAIGKL